MHLKGQLSPKTGIHLLRVLHRSHLVTPQQSMFHLVAPQQPSPVCKHQWECSSSAFVPTLKCRRILAYILQSLLPDLQDTGWCGRACQVFHFHCSIVGTDNISDIKFFSKALQFSLCSPRKQCKSVWFRKTHFLHWKKLLLFPVTGILWLISHNTDVLVKKIHYSSYSSYINVTVYNFYTYTATFTVTLQTTSSQMLIQLKYRWGAPQATLNSSDNLLWQSGSPVCAWSKFPWYCFEICHNMQRLNLKIESEESQWRQRLKYTIKHIKHNLLFYLWQHIIANRI